MLVYLGLAEQGSADEGVRTMTVIEQFNGNVPRPSTTFSITSDDSKSSISVIENSFAQYRQKEQWGFIAIAVVVLLVMLKKLFRRDA